MKTAKRIGKGRRRNRELNVKSSSARLHTKDGEREEQKKTEETEAAFKNIFLHHRPSDDTWFRPSQLDGSDHHKNRRNGDQILSLTEDGKALYIKSRTEVIEWYVTHFRSPV